MKTSPEHLGEWLVATWKTNHRLTAYLLENLPDEVWEATVPGIPRRTVRTIGAHLHNNRCSWIKKMGEPLGIAAPERVDRRTVSRADLVAALKGSSRALVHMIRAGLERGGKLPAAAWQNYPTDVVHFLAYHAVHEGHHRGQIVMIARQLGHRLPKEVTNGLWQWSRRAREVAEAP